MKKQFNKVIFIIINYLFAYIFITTFFIQIDKWHWEIDKYLIVNCSLYFLAFLLSFVIFKKSKYNSYIFLNLGLFAFVYAFGLFHIFVGDDYLFGNNLLMYQIYPFRKFILSFFICLTLVYALIEYHNYSDKVSTKYIKSLFIVLPINVAFYFDFLKDSRYVCDLDHLHELILCTIETNFIAIFCIGLYGYLLYNKDRPIGEYINSIIAILTFYVIYDTIDGFSEYYKIPISNISSYILTIILIFLNYFLLRKLKDVYSDFGTFYEEIKHSDKNLNIKILKKQTIITKIIKKIRNYFEKFPNRFFFILLMMISIVLFLYFFPTGYAKRIFIAFLLSLSLFILYLCILYKKREKTNNLI